MKGFLKGAVAVAMMMCAGGALAQESDYAGLSEAAVQQVQMAQAEIPPGVVLAAIERRVHQGDSFTHDLVYPVGQVPQGRREKMLGYLSQVAFVGAHTLYECWTRDNVNRFTSLDPNCETRTYGGVIGYIASTQYAGSVPLYRCFRNTGNFGDHFDSLDVNCEGRTYTQNDGILGYVWL